MSYDVFISYASTDKKAADAVCAILEKNKIRCWVTSRDIPPGVTWGNTNLAEISGSRVMMYEWTARSWTATKDYQLRKTRKARKQWLPWLNRCCDSSMH